MSPRPSKSQSAETSSSRHSAIAFSKDILPSCFQRVMALSCTLSAFANACCLRISLATNASSILTPRVPKPFCGAFKAPRFSPSNWPPCGGEVTPWPAWSCRRIGFPERHDLSFRAAGDRLINVRLGSMALFQPLERRAWVCVPKGRDNPFAQPAAQCLGPAPALNVSESRVHVARSCFQAKLSARDVESDYTWLQEARREARVAPASPPAAGMQAPGARIRFKDDNDAM